MTSFEERLENNKWLVFMAMITGFAASNIIDSFYRPFWFDELFTLRIAQAPSLTGLWEALGPTDPSPPLYYIITRLFQTVFGYGELATRSPAIISFLVALFFLFLILDRRCRAITAITGVLLLCLSPAALLVTNARTYTFILALCTISLWFWQVAAANNQRILPLCGLFLSLSMALYSHFYAFLLFVPIVAGEIYRSFKIKRFDWPVWLALLLAAATIIPLIPLAEHCTSLSKGFWSKPTSAAFLRCIYLYSSPALAVLMAFLISIGVQYFRKETTRSQFAKAEIYMERSPAAHEVVAAISLTLIPILGFIIAVCFTNAFTTRYFESAAIGAVIVLGYSRHLIRRTWVLEGILLLLVTTVFCVVFQVYLILASIESNQGLKFRINDMLNTGDDLPIVMLSPNAFLVTQHYAPEPLKQRLFYLIDYSLQFKYERNSPDISIAGLASLEPIKVDDLNAFLNRYKTFYIAGNYSPYMSALKTMVRPVDATAVLDDRRRPAQTLLKVSVNR